ncbi:MAG: type II secretion system protein [Luteolibacter sp.]|uniref:type II secretion system protein n=1 Tax=Luteolibacter sp. TaxID=1962973 RepID=UPI0032650E61
MKTRLRGFTLIELLIVVAIVGALAAIAMSISKSAKAKAQQTVTMQKMKALGTAFSTYVSEKNGLLPYEDATGTDDWTNAAKPENQEAWYNALPKLMHAPSVGEIGATNPVKFYDNAYPLYVPGAPYPSESKRLGSPSFAIGMNSRLQRKSEDGVKGQGRFAQIMDPVKTVIFLERGLPNDKKTMAAQRGFDGSPKANARAFAARGNQKGCLIFADGHIEVHAASDLLTAGGGIVVPQTSIVWTMNPESDPN